MNSRKLIISIFLSFILGNILPAQSYLNNSIVYDGETRQYSIYIPSSYNGDTAFPLMFNFHGGGGDIASQIAIADMSSIADTANFILVYPQALPDPNDGGSTNWLHKEPTTVDDVFFIEALIDSISSEYAINSSRIYACGYSLGGEFTYELACRLNHKIAAVGIVARTMYTGTFENCAPLHPTGILTILGTADFVSPYDGLEWGGVQYYLSADEVHDYWVTHNNASNSPEIIPLPNINQSDGSTVERYLWQEGDACVTVEHLKVIGGGHDWPGTFGNMDIDASLEIWKYVSQYDIEGLIDCHTTSIQETFDENNQMRIYPNPVSDYLIIDLEIVNYSIYKIFSPSGTLITQGKINSMDNSINISELPSDTYFLKIGRETIKFITY